MRPKGLIITVLLCLALLASACGSANNSGSAPPNNSDPDEQETPIKALDAGTILAKSDNAWLVTAYVEGSDNNYIDAYSLTVSDDTIMENHDGSKLAADQIPVGATVEVWRIGPLMESYPMQSGAYKFVLQDGEQAAGADRISRSAAIQAALESQKAIHSSDWFAVKSIALTADNAYWEIEIAVDYSTEQSALLRVDTITGEIERPIAEQNEAFRVYTPASGSQVGKTFTVEGQARVFEGAFSWTLEDGHNILAEGHETAAQGAPEWGDFSFEASLEQSSLPNVTLYLYTNSAKDGSVENQLVIGLQVPEELVQ